MKAIKIQSRHKLTNLASASFGFTLMELMISVVVMVLMMMAFGMIVTEAQNVVSTSESKIQANGIADTIRRVIENDLSKAGKTGFLCITSRGAIQPGTGTPLASSPRIILRSEKLTESKFENASANMGICSIGLASNDTSSSSGFGNVLTSVFVRQNYIPVLGGGAVTPTDVWNIDPGAFSSMDESTTFQLVLNLDSAFPSSIAVPPTDYDETLSLWQVLTQEANGLSILWTDGTKTGSNLNWYGIDFDPTMDENGRNIYPVPPNTDRNSLPEYPNSATPSVNNTFLQNNFVFKDSGNRYYAFWGKHNTTDWPKSIKISFRLLDSSLGNALEDSYTVGGEKRNYLQYEVICNLP